MNPVIAFGQQPCGIFPRRYLAAKIETARQVQKELGGDIVFFYHDSDHDPRETRTLLRHRKTSEAFEINFAFDNQVQRKFSPFHKKRVRQDWLDKTALQLPAYVDKPLVETFKAVAEKTVADFCIAMYQRMGLFDGIRIERSSDPAFRRAAIDIDDYFVDVPYDGEIVRARFMEGELKLHKGGDVYVTVPAVEFGKEHISPSRDSRLRWMQSVLHCTHYIAGAGEQAYLNKSEAPEITFLDRISTERADEAYVA